MAVEEEQPPWKVVRSFAARDGGCLVHLHNISGGVLAGDRLDLAVRVGSGVRAQVTTTGATRVYRARAGDPPARQSVCVSIGAGALLEYLPDAVIPFRGSRYVQDSQFRLEPGAGLFWWEILAPGRAGEYFTYERVELTSAIHAGPGPISIDRARLDPAARPLDNPLRLGRYTHLATFYICLAGAPAAVWARLEERLNAAADQMGGAEVRWGVSSLVRDGLMVRGLGMETRYLQRGLTAFWSTAKQELYGAEAVPPRKLY